MTIGTRLFTWLKGSPVGTDPAGNRYFEERRARRGARPRRWVLYAGEAEASAVPPEWWGWLHYTTAEPIPMGTRRPWQTPHRPNLTGTAESYRPPGHDYRGGHRAPATGDYESWTPGS
ncbi:MAG: NADH:ubiquinone oxidoreductase subunit NDUFA12 [Acetobacteraceae bacterium]